MPSEHIRNIGFDLVITLLTCGLFNFYVQYKQCKAVNAMLGKSKYSFLFWLLLTIITCGLYHIYHEYRMSADVAMALGKDPGAPGLLSVVLTIVGIWPVVDAIQQADINTYFGNEDL